MSTFEDPSTPREEMLTITVSFRGTPHSINLPLSSPTYTLHTHLEDLTDVPPALQKLLYKGKKLVWESAEDAERTTVESAGLKDGMKVQLLGSTLKELEGLKKEEAAHLRKERIMRERSRKPPVKLRSTGTTGSSSSPSLQYRFHEIKALPHLPNPSEAQALLQKLASDPAIEHIMQKHQLSVGLLTELAPHEHPELLGLNENMGQSILLRVRTNAYDGFRSYREVRRVLCHELAHNRVSNHGEDFKELDSQFNREVVEFERSVVRNTHQLGSEDIYQPEELEAEAKAYILGGDTTLNGHESVEERRQRILKATTKRLKKEAEELEDSCGTY